MMNCLINTATLFMVVKLGTLDKKISKGYTEQGTDEDPINNDLSCLKTYFDDNRLSVNVDNCAFMLLGTYQALRKIPSPQIHINNEPLRQVSVVKDLGMYIDEKLHWNHDIDTLVKMISSKIGILRSLRNIIPIDTLKLMYNAIVLPHFDYAVVVYDTASEINKFRLQRLQT